MSKLALMFFKPEFTIYERKKFFPLIKYYLEKYELSIEKTTEIQSKKNKTILFDSVYKVILTHALLPKIGNIIGSFEYLRTFKNIHDTDLFIEWLSMKSSIFNMEKNYYFLKKNNLKIINPFCPYQRRIFTYTPVSIQLFIIKKNNNLSWAYLKKRFQGAPIQKSLSSGHGIRFHLSKCRWYTPTTNGIHLSATDNEAIKEVKIAHNFF